MFLLDITDKAVPDPELMKGDSVHYKSLVETNKLINGLYRQPLLPTVPNDKNGNKEGPVMFKDELDAGVHRSVADDITLFRKPILDYMYETWSHEFIKNSNGKTPTRRDFDIPFAYASVLMEEEAGIYVLPTKNEDTGLHLSWGTNAKNNGEQESAALRLGPRYFTLNLEKDLNDNSKEVSQLQRLLCFLYPDKSTLEAPETLNPCGLCE